MTASPIGLSFAQNYEDVLLWRALGHVKDGRYLDIGACDPVVDSVSRAFYLAGWRGVHVDASATYAEALRQERPDETVVHAAVGDTDGFLTFYEFPETGLSTCVAEFAERHRQAGRVCKVSTVPVISLKELLNLAAKPEIHWLKIDVEGLEGSVLRSWGDSPVRPWVLVIESTEPNSQVPTEAEWIDMVHELGYHEVVFDGLSRFFVSDAHSELDEAFAANPNVFDDFHVTEHHFSTYALVSKWQAERNQWAGDVDALNTQLDRLSYSLQMANRLIGEVAGLMHSTVVLAIRSTTRRQVRRLRNQLQNWLDAQAGYNASSSHAELDLSAPDGVVPLGIIMSDCVSDCRNPNYRANSLVALCTFADIDFIRCAYVTLLGRQPDPTGEAVYLAQLRSGVSKLSILRQLRISQEGQKHDPGIAGLDRVLRRHRNANLPVIGRLVRWLTGREGDGAFDRRLRAIKHQQEMESRLAHLRSLQIIQQLQRRESSASRLHFDDAQPEIGRGSSSNILRHIAEGSSDWRSTLTASLKS